MTDKGMSQNLTRIITEDIANWSNITMNLVLEILTSQAVDPLISPGCQLSLARVITVEQQTL